MNILMMTNTYKPIVGGIEKSIEVFSSEYRSLGHNTLIVAPVFKDMPEDEEHIHRIPAIQNFNGTDFSVELPIPGVLNGVLNEFKPDIVHSHHPFLVGDIALRVAANLNIPIVFTYHTRYEMNTHYVPGDSEPLKKFVIELADGYSDLCDHVIAPSESIADLLKERGGETEITVIPTGINVSEYYSGNGDSIRQEYGIPGKAFVVGYLGRIAEEKNMSFLQEAVMPFMKQQKDVHFLVVGDGDIAGVMKEKARSMGVSERMHFTGILKGKEKIDAYHAMDVFVFASKSETQGIVLNEAMASGVPIIGLDAPGVREVIQDGVNGYLIFEEDKILFSEKLEQLYNMEKSQKESFRNNARATAGDFDYKKSVQKTLDLYQKVIDKKHINKDADKSMWETSKRAIKREMEIISNVVKSAGVALNIKKDENESKR